MQRLASKSGQEKQTDADNQQSGPAHELQVTMQLNIAVEGLTQRKIKTDNGGDMGANGKACKDSDAQRPPNVVDVKL